jgi:hypothetical protein
MDAGIVLPAIEHDDDCESDEHEFGIVRAETLLRTVSINSGRRLRGASRGAKLDSQLE